MHKFKLILCLFIVILFSGCVSRGESKPSILEAQRFIEKASSKEAVQFAPLELRFAREKLIAAQAAADQGNEQSAVLLAEQASLNAELAMAKVEASKARNDMLHASEVCDDLRTKAEAIIAAARGVQ
ncbi:MAG: DUF4398 domain-containing protein [bacterium]